MKRRRPVAVVEPPKYQYPTYDDVNSESSDKSIAYTNTIKPINVKQTLSVVSAIKLPDDVTVKLALNKSASSLDSDKPMISHAKPNFTLPLKPNSTIKTTPYAPISTKISKSASDALKSSYNISKTMILNDNSHENIVANYELPLHPSPPIPVRLPPKPVDPMSYKIGNNDKKKQLISHGKPNFVVSPAHKLHSPSKVILNSNEACQNYLEVKLKSLKSKPVGNDLQRVVDRKAIFEQTAVNAPKLITTKYKPPGKAIKSLKAYKTFDETDVTLSIQSNAYTRSPENSNEIHQALTRLRTTDSTAEIKSKNSNISDHSTPGSDLSTDSGHSSPVPLINRNDFEHQSVSHSSDRNQIKNCASDTESSTNQSNFAQKSFVSFSKELLDSPNCYPDKVQVTNTISSSTKSTRFVQRTTFKNI